MTRGAVDQALAGQFVRLRSELVHDGVLAELSSKHDGAGVSLLPVIAVLSWGYAGGALCPTARLRRYTGLESQQLAGARRLLEVRQLAIVRPGSRRGVWRVCVGDRLLAGRRAPHVRFPGRLVASGAWALFGAVTQAVVLSLAAEARSRVYVDSAAWGRIPAPVREQLDEWDAIEADSFDEDQLVVRWIGSVSLDRLAELAGVPASAAWDALVGLVQPTRLANQLGEPMIRAVTHGQSIWFQLWDTWWDNGCY